MQYDDYIRALATRAGLDEEAATTATWVTLRAVGQRMSEPERRRAAAPLPPPLALALRAGQPGETFDLAAFFARVAVGEVAEMGFAVEHARAVCEVLAEHLPAGSVEALRAALPADFAALFTEHPRRAARVGPSTPASGRTLASGRVESAWPLSDARPLETLEASERTLAGGRPHRGRPISESHPLASTDARFGGGEE